MKQIIFLIFLSLSCYLSFSQKIEVNVSNIQNFEHPLMKTDDAILLNKVVYLNAGNTDVKIVFDLTEMKFHKTFDDLKETLPIKTIRSYGDIIDVDVEYYKGFFVNYLVKNTDEKIMFCRWVKDGKIRGWCDKNVEIKKGN